MFLHRTLQEYLAACHLASLDGDQQSKMISRMRLDKDHLLAMLKFYCGLVKFKNKLCQFDSIVKNQDMLYWFHCACETQQDSVCHKVMELSDGCILLDSGVLTPADFNAIAYVITTASEHVTTLQFLPSLLYEEFIEDRWKNKEIDYNDVLSSSFLSTANVANAKTSVEYDLCSHVSYHKKSQSASIPSKLKKIQETLTFPLYADIKQLFQSCSDILSSDSAATLAKALKQCRNLTGVELVGNYNSRKSVQIIGSILKNSPNLAIFKLWGYISSSESKHLASKLQYCKHLQGLHLFGVNLHGANAAGLPAALSQCSKMKNLILSHCNINSEGATALAGALSDSKLMMFNLFCNDINAEGMQSLVNVSVYSELGLFACNIGNKGVEYLSHYLRTRWVLSTLDLSDNKIDSRGMKLLSKGLCKCFNLQSLNLSHNSIGRDGVVALAKGLKECACLANLELMNCNLGADGINHLSGKFNNWKCLQYLDLSDNGIISQHQMSVFAGRIKILPYLKALSLSNNSIDSRTAIVLAEGIQNCPLLEYLDVSNNSISSDGATALAQVLYLSSICIFFFRVSQYLYFHEHSNSFYISKKNVNFSNNKIDATSIDSMVALVQFSQLEKLDLSHNHIGSGSTLLVSELLKSQFPVQINLVSNDIPPEDRRSITQSLLDRKSSGLQVILY